MARAGMFAGVMVGLAIGGSAVAGFVAGLWVATPPPSVAVHTAPSGLHTRFLPARPVEPQSAVTSIE